MSGRGAVLSPKCDSVRNALEKERKLQVSISKKTRIKVLKNVMRAVYIRTTLLSGYIMGEEREKQQRTRQSDRKSKKVRPDRGKKKKRAS